MEPDTGGPATTEIDAAGPHVFPGLIAPRVHLHETNRTGREGFATGSRVLATGGATTVSDARRWTQEPAGRLARPAD